MAGFYMIGDIELKSVDNKVESFNKIAKLRKMLDFSIEKNEHTLILYYQFCRHLGKSY